MGSRPVEISPNHYRAMPVSATSPLSRKLHAAALSPLRLVSQGNNKREKGGVVRAG